MAAKLPAIVVKNNSSCEVPTTKKLAGIKISGELACDTSGASRLPSIRVNPNCNPCTDDGSEVVLDNYDYIGYTANLFTYQYNIIDNSYPGTYWVIVDGNYEYIGIPIDNGDLLDLLNDTLRLGTWTIENNILTVSGHHNYGEMLRTDVPITVNEGSMMPLFGAALNNVGFYYNDFTNNAAWNNLIRGIFAAGAFTAGAEPRWMHYESKEGGFDLIPLNSALATVSPNVGMRANPNEIYHFTTDTGGATDLQADYNATGVDFLPVTLSYCIDHGMVFIFTANICHGTTTELGQFLEDIIDSGVDFYVLYDNEVSSGVSGATPGTTLTSAQYLALLDVFHPYMQANYPDVTVVINAALKDRFGWSNPAVAAYAQLHNIPYFSQYFWLGDNAGNVPTANTTHDIDAYYVIAIDNTRDSVASGNNSLYGEVLPRLQVYYDLFYPVKMHVGQYGCSLQRTGYVANTMFHGNMIFNELFEIWKFNYTHNNFVDRAVFVENESAVDVKTAQDLLFDIDPAWEVVDGSDTFVKRIQGVAYELLQPLSTYSAGYPVFVPVTITNQPDKADAVAFVVGSEVYVWLYNILDAATISSIEVDSDELLTVVDVTGAYSTKLYGSIGSSPAYNFFKDYPIDSPSLVPTNVLRISELATSSADIPVPEHSIMKIKLTGVTTADAITINFEAIP